MATSNGTAVVTDHRIGTQGTVAIRLASAEVRIAGTDGDRVVVRTPDGRSLPDRVVIETTDDGLTVRERDSSGISFGRGVRTVQLEIDVPATAEVGVDTASGWIDVQGIRGPQRYRTAAGEIGLRGVAGRIDVNAVSGDLTVDLVDAAELAIRSVSGDVRISGGRLDSLRVQTTSGDVRVDSPLVGRSGNAVETLSGDVDLVAGEGIRVEARTVSGDLASDLPHRTDGRMGRRTMIVGDGAIELAFRSVSGDLRIRAAAELDRTLAGRSAAPPWASEPAAPKPLEVPAAPDAPAPPGAPEPPAASRPPAASSVPDEPADDPADPERMTILRSLERGELDVATAMELLAALDRGAADVEDGHA